MVVNIKRFINATKFSVSVENQQTASDNFSLSPNSTHDGNLWIPFKSSGAFVVIHVNGQTIKIQDDNYKLYLNGNPWFDIPSNNNEVQLYLIEKDGKFELYIYKIGDAIPNTNQHSTITFVPLGSLLF